MPAQSAAIQRAPDPPGKPTRPSPQCAVARCPAPSCTICSDRDIGLATRIKQLSGGPVEGLPTPEQLVAHTGDVPELGEPIMPGAPWHGVQKP